MCNLLDKDTLFFVVLPLYTTIKNITNQYIKEVQSVNFSSERITKMFVLTAQVLQLLLYTVPSSELI